MHLRRETRVVRTERRCLGLCALSKWLQLKLIVFRKDQLKLDLIQAARDSPGASARFGKGVRPAAGILHFGISLSSGVAPGG